MKHTLILLLFALSITGCSSYSVEDAKKNGDMITGPPGEINFDKLYEFLSDMEHNKENTIRITSFTDEGDPILQDLVYKNEMIDYTYDNLRDKFGGKNKGKYKTQCKRVETREIIGQDELDRVEYILTGCSEIIGIHDSDREEIYLLIKFK